MQDSIREHDREIRLAHTQTSAVSEHDYNTGHPPLWNEVTFIDRDPHSFTRRVKESIHMIIHSDNIDRTVKLKFQKHGCPRSARNTTTGELCDNGPPREQINETGRKRPRKNVFFFIRYPNISHSTTSSW